MSQVKFNNRHKPFKEALDARVKNYFEQQHLKELGNTRLFIKTGILLTAGVVTYLVLLLLHPAFVPFLLLWVLMGLLLACIGFNVMHDAAHGSYSRNRKVNEILSYTLDMMGGSSFMWKIKHNVVHHTYTNIAGEDDDIAKHPVFRFSPQQKWYWFHRYQHIYGPVMYSFTSLSWILFSDFQKYFTRKIEATGVRKMNFWENAIFWGGKLLNVGVFLIVPSLVFGFVPALVGFMVMHGVLGVTLSFVFQMAHCVEDTRFPAPDPGSRRIENEWALHQVATTANFAMGSRTLSWLVGGLNFQIEHHLFPRISHVHYPQLSRLVQQTCREFNVPYQAYPTFGKALVSHLRHLRHMGSVR
ncbi:acyl-CoA desaturase [Compostibacter hankyongensis]|uniref:Acyl-CoA desaturase n=1 Tax=Compostibacter hankyongensis TaxID=1007089 RepID=A0ABP8FTV5_9BACT